MGFWSDWWDETVDDTFDFFTSDIFQDDDSGTSPFQTLLGMGLGALVGQSGIADPKIPVVGYQGSIPEYQAVRQRVAMPKDPNRRPGAGGRRYFTDTIFAKKPESTPMTVEEAQAAAAAQAQGLAGLNPAYDPPPKKEETSVNKSETAAGTGYGGPGPRFMMGTERTSVSDDPLPKYTNELPRPEDLIFLAKGGVANLAQGRYLGGITDGMADQIPANVGGDEVRLSDGEFVIPADVVSHLGNGNSNAGAAQLHRFMDNIRKERTGNSKQGKEINPNRFLGGLA